MLNGLDLFSGIGGLTLALEDWVRPIAYCEIDRYCQGVLLSRMRDGRLPSAPIWDDIKALSARRLMAFPQIDIIYGGFPCQDISVAGHGRGLGGERSGLYWECCRLIDEIKPAFVFLENVPAIRTRGLKEVAGSLTELGYDIRWTRVSALEVGFNHRRVRWFCLASSNAHRKTLRIEQRGRHGTNRITAALDPSNGYERHFTQSREGSPESRVFRAGNGVPFAVDRDRALGNAVVPAQARKAFMKILGANEPLASDQGEQK